MILIVVIALVVFGPRKLPELGRTLGKALREFKQATRELTEEVTRVTAADEPAPRRPRPVSAPSQAGATPAASVDPAPTPAARTDAQEGNP